jgi:hypothetical protein
MQQIAVGTRAPPGRDIVSHAPTTAWTHHDPDAHDVEPAPGRSISRENFVLDQVTKEGWRHKLPWFTWQASWSAAAIMRSCCCSACRRALSGRHWRAGCWPEAAACRPVCSGAPARATLRSLPAQPVFYCAPLFHRVQRLAGQYFAPTTAGRRDRRGISQKNHPQRAPGSRRPAQPF